MQLTDAFERVIVLNLPFKTDRRARLERHLAETGICDPAKVKWERAICGDWTWAPTWWGGGNGAWGCLMSHVRVAQDAIHDSLSNYLVLEDDVYFHPRAGDMLTDLMRELPADWGQLYLGGQYLHQEPEMVPGTSHLMRPFNVNRTHAFALSKATMPRFLCHVMHAPDYFGYTTTKDGWPQLCSNHYHIDHQLGRAHERRDWPTYSPKWWLAGQDEGPSNVSGRVNPRMWWHWRSWGRKLPVIATEPGEELPPELARKLHFGNTLIPGTYLDVAVKPRMEPGALVSFLHTIAGEAIEQWRLPAIQRPQDWPRPEFEATLEAAWKPGWATAEQAASIGDYPFNSTALDPFQPD